jgi:hypothetical protein
MSFFCIIACGFFIVKDGSQSRFWNIHKSGKFIRVENSLPAQCSGQ